MKKFRQKQFTIQEGHYTGPKDMDKVPGALEVVSKSALAGTGIGAAVGGMLKDSSVLGGAVEGGKWGTIAGVVLKFFLNYLHNPMNTIKFSEVDKNIRREFGIYRMAGITVGDSLSKRATLEEKFAFNDREVTNFKLNFCIQDNKVTMYTFGMTDKELIRTSDCLDYYCKKYTGMDYSSALINRSLNSYSVCITFTNYQIISNFIMELSKLLETRINLLNNKALVDSRLSKAEDSSEDESEKSFSFGGFNKYDLFRVLGKGGTMAGGNFLKGGPKAALAGLVIGSISEALGIAQGNELAKIPGANIRMSDLRNEFLKDLLTNLHYVDGVNYTTGEMNCPVNMSIVSGIFLISCLKDSKEEKKIDEGLYKRLMGKIKKVLTPEGVIVYSLPIQDRASFSNVLNTFMKLGLKPNIHE